MNTPSAVVHRLRANKTPTHAVRDVSDTTLRGLVDIFQMLADKSRLKILLALARESEMHVTALRTLLQQSQPAISHHLALLRSHRLVSCRRDGKNNFYALDSSMVRDLLDQFFGDAGNGQGQLQMDGFSLAFENR